MRDELDSQQQQQGGGGAQSKGFDLMNVNDDSASNVVSPADTSCHCPM
jgi:hypothetical protein